LTSNHTVAYISDSPPHVVLWARPAVFFAVVAQRSTISKLASALPYHFKEGAPYRESRLEMLRDRAGRTTYPAYRKDADPEKQIVNLAMQSAEAFTMSLAASRPRFNVSSRYVEFEDFASRMGRALDRYAEDLYLEENLQQIVEDSHDCVGIAKVYQASSAAVAAEVDYRMDQGRPYVQRICLDRFVWDTNATSPEEATFMGDYYTMPYRQAITSRRFSRKARAAIKEKGHEQHNAKSSERGEDLARSQNDQPVDDLVYMVDVFIRHKRAIYTFLCDRQMNLLIDKPLQKVMWEGEECGPYYFLNMGPVPDHFMPSSPGQNQRLLCQLVNTLYRKLESQCRRQKNIGVVAKGSGDQDVAINAVDGDWAEFNEPQSVRIERFDGPDQNIFGAAVHFEEKHSQAAGNLKHKLGLAQSADTATQERMIGAMSSRLEAFYQERFVAFVRRVSRGLARLIYNDQQLKIPGKLRVPGTSIDVDDDWLGASDQYDDGTPSREGYFDFYRVDIDPESMSYKSSADRMAAIDREVQTWLPMLPMLWQKGHDIDLNLYFEEKARLTGMPIFARLFKSNQTPFVPETGGSSMSPSAGGAQGEYLHRSVSNKSPEAEALSYFQSAQPEGSAA
jgi:hypothetical protein